MTLLSLEEAHAYLNELRAAVEDIKQITDDDEVAHIMEDKLHQRVLQDIADGKIQMLIAKRAAEIALRTRDIDFSRWYA